YGSTGQTLGWQAEAGSPRPCPSVAGRGRQQPNHPPRVVMVGHQPTRDRVMVWEVHNVDRGGRLHLSFGAARAVGGWSVRRPPLRRGRRTNHPPPAAPPEHDDPWLVRRWSAQQAADHPTIRPSWWGWPAFSRPSPGSGLSWTAEHVLEIIPLPEPLGLLAS